MDTPSRPPLQVTPPRPRPDVVERARRLDRLRRFARLLDSSVRIPGTGLTIGLDPLVGLAPGVGDVLMFAAGAWIIVEGHRLGASRAVVVKMILNLGIDTLVGTVPVAGDLFDAAWKANQRNIRLLEAALNAD